MNLTLEVFGFSLLVEHTQRDSCLRYCLPSKWLRGSPFEWGLTYRVPFSGSTAKNRVSRTR